MVFSSGTRAPKPSPKKRMKESRSRIWYSKAHEGEPVADLVFCLLVRKPVESLQHQYLEHENRIIGRATALGAVRTPKSPLQRWSEDLEVNCCRQPLQGIGGPPSRKSQAVPPSNPPNPDQIRRES
jgi:hypothetical protein